MQPAILPKIREIVLMGGAYGTGNFTPSAEFNIFADPEAARVVFTSGVPLVMMGLDLTNQTVCTPDVIARMNHQSSMTIKHHCLRNGVFVFICFILEADALAVKQRR